MSLLSTSVTLPSLRPRLVDPLWLKLDEPKDDAWQLNCAQRWHDEALSEVANRKAPIAIGLNLLNRQGQSSWVSSKFSDYPNSCTLYSRKRR